MIENIQSNSLISFDVKLNDDDIKNFHREAYKVNVLMKIVACFSVLVIIMSLSTFLMEPTKVKNLLFVIIILCIFIFGFFISRSQNLKLFHKNEGLQSDMTYCIDEQKVECKRVGTDRVTNWSTFYKVTENKTHIYLWFNQKQAQILPKRCISDDKLNSLHILINKRLKK